MSPYCRCLRNNVQAQYYLISEKSRTVVFLLFGSILEYLGLPIAAVT